MLGAWAEQTSRVEIAALVTCNSYRNPDLLADMARTIDHISDGRLILGIGSGWFEKDYDNYGYEFGTAGGRLNDLAAAMPRIEDRWAKLNPAPTRKIPVLIGGGGEKKTLRIVARHADIWHSFSDVETFQRKSEILRGWCDEAERDFGAIERSVAVQRQPGRRGRGLPGRRRAVVHVERRWAGLRPVPGAQVGLLARLAAVAAPTGAEPVLPISLRRSARPRGRPV